MQIEQIEHVLVLFGNADQNIKIIEEHFGVNIVCRGTEVKITGESEAVSKAQRTIDTLLAMIQKDGNLSEQNIRYVMTLVEQGSEQSMVQMNNSCIAVTVKGKPIKPKTLGQKKYIDAIETNTITFGIGPAGTGKTYLAVAMAVRAFRDEQVSRIILTRPAVEAGEKLGFLPGDLQDKVDPYLRPLYDAMFDMMGPENFQRNMEKGCIEVAPLAYMRGRTLDDSFIILDEAQNTTPEQMKMFLTRLGFNSKAIVTGDVTQIDLPNAGRSGLIEAVKVLKNIDDIAIMKLTEKDVVRHKLVQDIITAYERYHNKEARR
ncbi:PhoH family protein [Negativibacillus massiliensis]|uniref:PhoH family protein n=2 Tax=Negativibacillus massiliensis TaxID=1871035 RepID=UPI002A7F0DBB|nr:PhoH family protein [Negativibacillus massiliensis]MDY4048199.1 PhoH family protein [Negativibacillus massiliensis]